MTINQPAQPVIFSGRPTVISDSGKAFLRQQEGCKLEAYPDGTGYSIGYGNTYYADGTKVKYGDRITQAQADRLFDTISEAFSKEVLKYVTSNINQNQLDALTSYAYNRGMSKFRSSHLFDLVNINPNNSSITEQFAIEWGSNTQYKSALIQRRIREAALYFNASLPAQTAGVSKIVIIVFGLIILTKILDNGREE